MNPERSFGAQRENLRSWEGQVADGLFPLREYIGGDAIGAYFVTEFEGQRAAIKVVPASGAVSDQLRSHWRLASMVSHPHLIRLFKVGRCQVDGTAVAYVVMEYADENLGQVLSERALTAAEVREMLEPAADVIACIHREGFVHGRLRPANILAAGDCLKLSSDNLRSAGNSDDLPPLRGAYRAPENAAGEKLSRASDIWALGVTVVEALTQFQPTWAAPDNDLVLPEGIAEPFHDIAVRCLRANPQERATADEIGALLKEQTPARKKSPTRWYGVAAAGVAAVAILAVWFTSRSSSDTVRPTPAAAPEVAVASPVAKPAPAATPIQPAPAPPAATPIKEDSSAPAPEPEAGPSASVTPVSPDVVSQPMPDVLPKATQSIHGKVTVGVRVQVDSYGAVREATLATPGSSRYFVGVTLKAVRRWKFRPVRTAETFVPQEWNVRFEFTRDDTKVSAERVAP